MKNAENLFKAIFLCTCVYLSILISYNTCLASEPAIPDILKPWVQWVLHNKNSQTACIPKFNNADSVLCAFPTSIYLDLNEKGGTFIQEWQIYNETYIPLPGNSSQWVLDVSVGQISQDAVPQHTDPQTVVPQNNIFKAVTQQAASENNISQAVTQQAVVLQDINGTPSIKLKSGYHIITGRFAWQKQPEYIQIPPQSAFVSLTIDGRDVDSPNIDNLGRLWLITSHVEQKEENRLKVESFRLIEDTIPSKVTLYLLLDIAGSAREIKLGPLYSSKEFVPLSIETPLPSKLEPDGTIRIQAAPGRYNLTLTMRYIGHLENLSFDPPEDGYMPKQEIWSFVRKPELRVVEISGVSAIDPKRTSLPEHWKSYPAYTMYPKDVIKFKEIKRGDPVPPPDQLNLHRIFWLGFNGKGYTVQDRITGSKNSGWRLELDPLMAPGKVTVDGIEQLITKLELKKNKDVQKAGVELRRGSVNLIAESKIKDSIYNVPATGWLHSFQKVTGTLNLPAGWTLIAANGIDNIPGTWIKKWSLLDIFIVLIFTISVAKLFSIPISIIGFITLVLLYHENGSPRYIWLFLLFGFVLLKLTHNISNECSKSDYSNGCHKSGDSNESAKSVKYSRLRTTAKIYQFIVVVLLILISIPYAVDSLRIGIYPQLENRWISMNDAVKNGDQSMNQKYDAQSMNQQYADNVKAKGLMTAQPESEMDISDSEIMMQEEAAAPALSPSKTLTDSANQSPKEDYSMRGGYGNIAENEFQTMQKRASGPISYLKSERDKLYKQKSWNNYEGYNQNNRHKRFMQYDPKSLTQTGPGLPLWKPFRTVNFSWTGPVEPNNSVTFFLIGPTINLILAFLRVFLIILLSALMFYKSGFITNGFNLTNVFNLRRDKRTAVVTSTTSIIAITSTTSIISIASTTSIISIASTTSIISILIILFIIPASLLNFPASAYSGEIPSSEILQELQERLLEKDKCFPNCADISKIDISIQFQELELTIYADAAIDTVIPLPSSALHWLPKQVLINGGNAKALFRLDEIFWVMIPAGKNRLTVTGTIGSKTAFQMPLNLKPHFISIDNVKDWEIQGVHSDGKIDDQLQFKKIVKQSSKEEILETGNLPPFVLIERTILLGLDWRAATRIERLNSTGSAVVLNMPLLDGESVITEGIRVKDKKAQITLNSNQTAVEFESFLEPSDTIHLYHSLSNSNNQQQMSKTKTDPKDSENKNRSVISSAAKDNENNKNKYVQNLEWTEIWKLDASPIFHVETEGIPVIMHKLNNVWYPAWHPYPGEEVILKIYKPDGIGGQTMTIEKSSLELTPGQRTTAAVLNLSIKSSQGGQHTIKIPKDAELQEVKINQEIQIIRQEGEKVIIPISPGNQNIELAWKEDRGITTFYRISKIDLGSPSVNAAVDLNVSYDRWTLFAGGEHLMGPAVLFWSVVIVIFIASLGLSLTNLTPLKFYQWFLLGIGISMTNPFAALFVAAWLIIISMRKKWGEKLYKALPLAKSRFNLMQLGIIFLTFTALMCLLTAVSQGLLGHPSMNITGNGSYGNLLRWYQDVSDNVLPCAWLFSLPMAAYRFAMLLWALWLSFWLISTIKTGWSNFSYPVIWAVSEAVSENNNIDENSSKDGADSDQKKPEQKKPEADLKKS